MRPLVLFFIAVIAASPATAGEMPEGFVYLRDVDPTILQDMRYASDAQLHRPCRSWLRRTGVRAGQASRRSAEGGAGGAPREAACAQSL